MLWCLGRHTITQCLLSLGLTDADWSLFYCLFSHRCIAIATVHDRLFQETLPHMPPDTPYMLAVDSFPIPCSSLKMACGGWSLAPNTAPFRRGLRRAQRFGALHWLPPLEHGFTRAIPLISYPCFTPKAKAAAAAPQREWEGALAALHTLRTALDAAGWTMQPIVLLADGSYDVVAFWRALPHDTYLAARPRAIVSCASCPNLWRQGSAGANGSMARTPRPPRSGSPCAAVGTS